MTANISDYLRTVENNYAKGIATEHTYRPELKILVEGLGDAIDALNEPQHVACGAPDFLISRKTGHGPETLGYIETKDIGKPLSQEEHSEQMKRYLAGLPELGSQPRPSAGGKLASLDAAVPGLRLPLTAPADQLVGLNIAYTYDPLGRLTRADYSDGTFFHYTYDAVGNRLTQTTQLGTVNYVYDDANRLTSVGGVSYTWDANGNLLSDGSSTYAYDHANRPKSLVQGSNTYTYTYNGLGNRVSQTLNAGTPVRYVLDQAAGLVQVLSDGSYTYLYGNDRLAQQSVSETEYFLTDALGSVRQFVDSDGEITLNRSYDPYGNVLASSGDGESVFAFTGEQMDGYSNLLYLRARSYSLSTGRFVSRDTWQGDTNQPMSYNAWLYTYYITQFSQPDSIIPDPYNPLDWNRYAYVRYNPVNYSDPSGHKSCIDVSANGVCLTFADDFLIAYDIQTSGLTYKEKWELAQAAGYDGALLSSEKGGKVSSDVAFRKDHGNVTVKADNSRKDCITIGSEIRCGSGGRNMPDFLHEFGHVVDVNSGGHAHDLDSYNDAEGNPVDGGRGNTWVRGSEGFKCNTLNCMGHPPSMGYDYDPNCTGPNAQSSGCAKAEQWADLYMNLALDGTGDPNHGFTNDAAGDARRKYMQQQFEWLFQNGYLQ